VQKYRPKKETYFCTALIDLWSEALTGQWILSYEV
jgi:hypothetical protein